MKHTTITKEKPVTEMVMKLVREFPSKQALSPAAQTATNKSELPEQSGLGGKNNSYSASAHDFRSNSL